MLPRHIGHEERGVMLIESLCERVGVPNRYRNLAVLVARYHGVCHRAAELKPKTILKVLEAVDAFRRPETLGEFLTACEADARGRAGLEERPYPQAGLMRAARDAAANVNAAALRTEGLEGPALGEAIRQERCAAIALVTAGTPDD
jgi:tRNA nucleotidyltransferase (CCA-adding enzyme)